MNEILSLLRQLAGVRPSAILAALSVGLVAQSLPASAQDQVIANWQGLYLGGGPGYYMSSVGDPATACKQSWDSFSGHSGLTLDSLYVHRNHTGNVVAASCRCSFGSCATGYWGTAGQAKLTCPAGYAATGDAPYFCVKATPVDVHPCGKGCSGKAWATVGDPIDVTSGALVHQIPLISTADGRLQLKLTYNSRSEELNGIFGNGWSTNIGGHYERNLSRVFVNGPDSTAYYFIGTTHGWEPQEVSGGVWSSTGYRRDANFFLWENGSGEFNFTDGAGTIYTYFKNGGSSTSYGGVKQIRYPSGYVVSHLFSGGVDIGVGDSLGREIVFSYHQNGKVATVTDPDGKVYKFTYKYPGGVLPNTRSADAMRASLGKIIYPDDTPGTDADNPTREFHYETVNGYLQLTGMTDERGVQVATWSYEDGRAISFSGPNGYRAVDLDYDDGARTTSVENAFGLETIYYHSLVRGIKILSEIEEVASANVLASSRTFALDSNGRAGLVTAPDGQKTLYTPEASRGLPLTIQEAYGDPENRTRSISYYPWYPVATETVEPGLTTTYEIAEPVRVESMTQTDTTTVTVPYTTSGATRVWDFGYTNQSGIRQLTSVDGPLSGTSDTVSYTYDAQGNLASVTNEVGHTTTINSVNGRGQPTQITDPNGLVTDIDYTPRGWVEQITINPGGSARTTSFEYDLAGNLTKTIFPEGGWLEYEYLDEGMVERITSSEGEIAEYTHNALGKMLTSTRKMSGGSVLYSASSTYDDLGRLIESIGASSQTTEYEYDASGRLVELTDPRSKLYSYGFDALNRLISVTDPDSDVESIGYNSADNWDEFEDGKSVTTTFVHNGFGEVIRETSPDRGVTDYWYDAAGRLTKKLDAEGQEVLYSYDASGRLLGETFTGASALDRTYTYDSTASGNKGVGRLTTVTDASGIQTFFYDVFGDLVSETRSIGAYSFITAYEYDDNGELTKITYPSGREVSYVRDGLGRATSITTRSAMGQPVLNVATGIDWLPFGPLSEFTAGNGLATAFGHDADYRMTSIDVNDGGATNTLDLTFGYDAASNVTSMTDTINAGRSDTYTYTDDDRLASASGGGLAVNWTYDGNGNRLSEVRNDGLTTETDSYVYASGSNRLEELRDSLNVLIRSFAYDDNGRITDDDRSGAGDFDYTYDADGRLAGIDKNSTLLAVYAYDAWGQRIKRQTYGAGAQTRFYLYDRDGLPIAETDGSGVTLREYIWLEGRLVGLTTGSGAGSTLYFVHRGYFGQPLRMTNASMSVVWDADIQPFGEALVAMGATPVDLRLPGQWEQTEAGFYQNWWRDYDPTIGRYLQADPIGLLGGSNVFGYAHQNPLSFADPMGLDVIVATGTPFLGDAEHQAMYVGNDKNGWTLHQDTGKNDRLDYSKPDESQRNSRRFASAEEAMADAKRRGWPHLNRHSANRVQDEIMRQSAYAHFGQNRGKYNALWHNCGDLVERTLASAGIEFPDTVNPREARPNWKGTWPLSSRHGKWSQEKWGNKGWYDPE